MFPLFVGGGVNEKNHDETPLRLEKTPRHRNTQGTAIDSHLTILGVWHFLHRFLCHSLGFDLYRQTSAVDAVDIERGATWMCQKRETRVSEDTLNIKYNPGLFAPPASNQRKLDWTTLGNLPRNTPQF